MLYFLGRFKKKIELTKEEKNGSNTFVNCI